MVFTGRNTRTFASFHMKHYTGTQQIDFEHAHNFRVGTVASFGGNNCGAALVKLLSARFSRTFNVCSCTTSRVRDPIPNQVRGSNFPSCVQLPFDLFG